MITLKKAIEQLKEDKKNDSISELFGEFNLPKDSVQVSEKEAIDIKTKQWNLYREYEDYLNKDSARLDVKVDLKDDHWEKMDEYNRKKSLLPRDVFCFEGNYYIQN